ncbi:hypothetical protein CERSUDRAFT_76328 [Gelatoporia subvermispora B]|uniref:Uncharacterized protein n=1 Tax=Ceriporiopsis subvermispora (strain B) TaxID=914234 RepID=M2R3V0_CERS8|nr:hypothetical protein CERSUDRAFT_76328 [Gelatoporia subvermispora B]
MDLTLGAVEVGTLVSIMLYGMATIQTFHYFETGKSDSKWLRSFVAAVWLLETVHATLSCIYVYTVTVTEYDAFDRLLTVQWSFTACVVMHDVLSSSVQSFYAYRIYVLSRQVLFAVLQWMGSILRIALILALLGYAVNVPTLDMLVTRHKRLAIATVASIAVLGQHRQVAQLTELLYGLWVWCQALREVHQVLSFVAVVPLRSLSSYVDADTTQIWHLGGSDDDLRETLNARGAMRRGTEQDGPAVIGISGFNEVIDRRRSARADTVLDIRNEKTSGETTLYESLPAREGVSRVGQTS